MNTGTTQHSVAYLGPRGSFAEAAVPGVARIGRPGYCPRPPCPPRLKRCAATPWSRTRSDRKLGRRIGLRHAG